MCHLVLLFLVIAWLFAFWFAVQRWILAPAASDDMVITTE